jgi:hypothetical protein
MEVFKFAHFSLLRWCGVHRWIAEGDQLAMRMLVNRRRVALYRWLLQLVGDKALAEDLSFPKIISGRIGGAARTGSGAGPLDRPT